MAARWSLSGRHLATGTTPGSTRSRPAKNRAVPGPVPERGRVGHPLVVHLYRLAPVGVEVVGRVRDHQVAAGRQPGDQPGHQPGRVLLVGDELQDRQQHQGHRPAEVQCPGRSGQDGVRVVQVGLDVVARTLPGALQQGLGMQQHDGVVVDVDDPAVRRLALGDLVGVVRGRDAGADVEELPDAGLPGQVPHRPGQELAVGLHRLRQLRIRLQGQLARLAVGGEVVLAAEPVVVDPCRVRPAGVDARRRGLTVHPPRISRFLLGNGLVWHLLARGDGRGRDARGRARPARPVLPPRTLPWRWRPACLTLPLGPAPA
jgi:hypothetical protein